MQASEGSCFIFEGLELDALTEGTESVQLGGPLRQNTAGNEDYETGICHYN